MAMTKRTQSPVRPTTRDHDAQTPATRRHVDSAATRQSWLRRVGHAVVNQWRTQQELQVRLDAARRPWAYGGRIDNRPRWAAGHRRPAR